MLAWIGAMSLLGSGCLLDIAPKRGPLDERWENAMLAGEFGRWADGNLVVDTARLEDRIDSSFVGTKHTKYRIELDTRSTLGEGEWKFYGGLMGRARHEAASVELFGKEIVRVHGLARTVNVRRDYSYEFFLVVRRQPSQQGKLVRRWSFGPTDLAFTISPENEGFIRSLKLPQEQIDQLIERSKNNTLIATLAFDPQTKIATVRIDGLVRPFEEHVDLSPELGR